MYLHHHPNYCKSLKQLFLIIFWNKFSFWCSSHCYFLLKWKECDSKKKANKPFYFKHTIKIWKFFCDAKSSKKLLQCNDFNRLKKNKKSIFSIKIAQKLAKIWNRKFTKYDVIKTTWSGHVRLSWRKKHINTLQILLHIWRYKKPI